MFQLPQCDHMIINIENRNAVVMVGSKSDMDEHAERLNQQYQTNAYVVKPYPHE